MKRRFSTNSRLVNELFASYISTFSAFCELINNSIQAKAKNIKINIDYPDIDELHKSIIREIVIEDDGVGVHVNDFERKILDVGTTNKEGGKGIGRFAAFQIGKKVNIETIGFSQDDNTFSKVILPLAFENFGNNINLSDIDVDTQEDILVGKHNTYYKVTIKDFYDSTVTDNEPRKKIIEKFLQEKIKDSIFERYPLKIFNREIKFHINGSVIDPNEFVIGSPEKITITYTDKKGHEHNVLFDSMQIKSMDKIKIFLTTKNAGIQTIANGFEFDANWLSPRIGGWFVYISADSLAADMFRNIDLDGLDEHVKHYKDFIKLHLTEFFREKNREYDNFTDKLKSDEFYPYKYKSSSQSKVILFDKLAFLVEDKYNILNEKNRLREIVYPLIDRTISNGELDKILRSILKLNSKMMSKFSDLLEKTELDNIIEFSDKVASKIEDIEFLEKLVYSDISKHVKERKELHKFLERMLWVFGEEYSDSTRLLSDKGLENNLNQLRDDILQYKPSKHDDNIAELTERPIKSITDLFMYSQRIIDSNKREVLVVELKAPKVKLSPKELGQVMKYAREIEKKGSISNKIKFKILLISSEINSEAEFDIRGRQKGQDNPYFYFENEDRNIEVWVMKWSDLIENVKRKLKYMSAVLQTKDVDVQEKAAKDFEGIDFGRTSSTLKKVALN